MSLKEEIKNILSRRIQEYNTSVANKFNIRVEELENMWNNLELDRPKTPIEQYEYKKYACSSSSEVLDMLRKYGVAILPGVLDREECKSMFSGMWDFLETITGDFDKPISRDDPESWKGLRKLYPSHSILKKKQKGRGPV